jgi:hypothetical protein
MLVISHTTIMASTIHLTTLVLFSDNGGILLLKREGQRVPAEKNFRI